MGYGSSLTLWSRENKNDPHYLVVLFVYYFMPFYVLPALRSHTAVVERTLIIYTLVRLINGKYKDIYHSGI